MPTRLSIAGGLSGKSHRSFGANVFNCRQFGSSTVRAGRRDSNSGKLRPALSLAKSSSFLSLTVPAVPGMLGGGAVSENPKLTADRHAKMFCAACRGTLKNDSNRKVPLQPLTSLFHFQANESIMLNANERYSNTNFHTKHYVPSTSVFSCSLHRKM